MGKRETKQAVAKELIVAAGTMIEFWSELFEARKEDPPCSAAEAAEMVARWLEKLPGDFWDNRLPQVWED